MRYIANPVEVDAFKIVSMGNRNPDGMTLVLESGETVRATPEMIARMIPKVDDYWVIQAHDGYIYLNPKDVFERKYRPLGSDILDAEKASSA